jgi:hypothetical protein
MEGKILPPLNDWTTRYILALPLLRRYAREGRHSLANDDELALNRGAHEPVRAVGSEIEAPIQPS